MNFKKILTILTYVSIITFIPIANTFATATSLPSITKDKSFHKIIIGPLNDFRYDLNGDGKSEYVSLKRTNKEYDNAYTLFINNQISIPVNCDEGPFGMSVLDLDKSDKYKQIAIFQSGSNDYDFVDLYTFKNNKIKHIGELPAAGKELYINNKSLLSTEFLSQFFQTNVERLYYQYNSQKDTITEIKLPYYAYDKRTIFAKVRLHLKKQQKASSANIATIKPGEKLKVIGTDLTNWVLLENSKGVRGWLQITNKEGLSYITEVNKYVTDVFGNLWQVG